MAAAENLDIDGIKIVDSENSEKNEEYANVFYELRKKKGITPEQAAETIKDPSYYAKETILGDYAYYGCLMIRTAMLTVWYRVLFTHQPTQFVRHFKF